MKNEQQKEPKEQPKERLAKCPDCGKFTVSRKDLPFFVSCPDEEYDLYACGCRGWD